MEILELNNRLTQVKDMAKFDKGFALIINKFPNTNATAIII